MVKIRRPFYFFSSFLSGFKNALLKRSSTFLVHYSRFNSLVCEYFFKNHFFSDVFYLFSSENKNFLFIFIVIETFEGFPVLSNVRSVSGRSRYVYMNVYTLKRKLIKDRVVFLLSTSEGIINSLEATFIGIGGVVLFEYY